MKYIIEVEDERTDGLYRVKGFETLVFDEAGLKKLEPVSDALQHGYEDGYQDGLNDAWELAKEEQKNAGLKVGDEIEIRGESSIPKMVVTRIDDQYISTVDANGDTRCICKDTTTFVKTGRRFPQIEEILWQMEGE